MKTVREQTVGKARLRIVQIKGTFAGLVFLDGAEKTRITDADAGHLWQQLLAEAAKLNPNFLGFDGARARFLRRMPHGFADPAYVTNERTWKLRAKAKLDAALPLEAAIDGPEMAGAQFRLSGRQTSCTTLKMPA